MYDEKNAKLQSYPQFVFRKNSQLIQFYYLRFENFLCCVEQNFPSAFKNFKGIRPAVFKSV